MSHDDLQIVFMLKYYKSWIILPILATTVWFAGLTSLLGLWISQGRPRYDTNVADVAFISDIGGANETLFLCICIFTDLLYFSSVCAIKWLRHRGRLPEHIGKWENICGWLAVVFCFSGCAGLFTLAKACSQAWNAYDYTTVHWDGTLIFIIGTGSSAFFQTAEVWLLRKGHKHRKHLPRNAWFKLLIVSADIILAAAFGATYLYCGGRATAYNDHTTDQCNSTSSKAAILEWTIAYALNLYFLTFVIDLWPAGKVNKTPEKEEESV